MYYQAAFETLFDFLKSRVIPLLEGGHLDEGASATDCDGKEK
jgi:hypothetical protein